MKYFVNYYDKDGNLAGKLAIADSLVQLVASYGDRGLELQDIAADNKRQIVEGDVPITNNTGESTVTIDKDHSSLGELIIEAGEKIAGIFVNFDFLKNIFSELDLASGEYPTKLKDILHEFGISIISCAPGVCILRRKENTCVCIDNTVKAIPEDCLNKFIYSSNCKVLVLGGRNLMHADDMFKGCMAYTIAFDETAISNLVSTRDMFRDAIINTLNLNVLNVSCVTDASGMFWNAEIGILNMSDMQFGTQVIMQDMFHFASIDNLAFGQLNRTVCKTVYQMFDHCYMGSLSFEGFNLLGIAGSEHIFKNTYVDTTYLDDMSWMAIAARFVAGEE